MGNPKLKGFKTIFIGLDKKWKADYADNRCLGHENISENHKKSGLSLPCRPDRLA